MSVVIRAAVHELYNLRLSVAAFLMSIADAIWTPNVSTVPFALVLMFMVTIGHAVLWTIFNWQRKPVGINKDENQILP